jgi:ABC-type lipoprotein release transport system permease subunit
MKTIDPLSPLLHVRRRFGRVLPTALVVALVSALLVLVVTPTNTFEETTRANVRALDAFTVVAPAARPDFSPELEAKLTSISGIDTTLSVRALWIRYPMLVGEAFCAFVLAGSDNARDLATRCGLVLAEGRWPRDGEAEVAIQDEVARARGLAVGDAFGTLVDPEDTTPGRFEVVGLLRGRTRLAVGTAGGGLLGALVLSRTPPFRLVLAKPGAKETVDSSLHAVADLDRPAFRVIDAAYMRARTERALRNVPLLSGAISFAVALVVALVAALLQLVVFQARIQECAVLLAIGQSRGRLVRSFAAEAALIAVTAWIVGVLGGWLLLTLWVHGVLEPRGLVVRLTDLRAVLLSAFIPLASLLAGVWAIVHELRGLDPIALLQGRGR